MRKMKKYFLGFSSLLGLGTVATAVACANKSTQGEETKKPDNNQHGGSENQNGNGQNPSDGGTKDPQGDDPNANIDVNSIQGGNHNGVAINKHLELLKLLNLSNKMSAYDVYNAINNKSFSNQDYKINKILVKSFSDEKGTLSFGVEGTFKDADLKNLTFELSGLYVYEVVSNITIKFNTDKIISEKKQPEYFINKPYNDIKPYLSDFSIYSNGENNDLLTNNNFDIKKFTVVKNKDAYVVDINIDYNVWTMIEGNNPTSVTKAAFFGSNQRSVSGLSYNETDYLNYVLKNKVQRNENGMEISKYYASYFEGRKLEGVDLTSELFTITDGFDTYNEVPIGLESEFRADDINGTLTMNISLSLEGNRSDEKYQSSTFKEETLTGFLKVSPELLKKIFVVVVNSAKLKESNKNLVKLIDQYKKVENKENYEIDSTSPEFRRIFSNNNILIIRDVEGSQDGDRISVSPANKKIYINALFNGDTGVIGDEHDPFQIDLATKLIGSNQNGFQINSMSLNLVKFNDFKLSNGEYDRLDFKLQYQLEIGINGQDGSDETIQIPGSASIYVTNNPSTSN
ncbi:hypothetical protein ACX1M3_00510 [Mycoplasma sp. Z463D]